MRSMLNAVSHTKGYNKSTVGTNTPFVTTSLAQATFSLSSLSLALSANVRQCCGCGLNVPISLNVKPQMYNDMSMSANVCECLHLRPVNVWGGNVRP
jgi:hypothetical protein